MKRRRWVFGAVLVAGVVALVAPAVGQGKAESKTLTWSLSRGGATVTSYDFGNVDAGSRGPKGFRLGSSTLTKSGRLAIRLTGSSAFSITVNTCRGKSLGKSLSCWVGVVYAPPIGASTSDSATLTAIGVHGGPASLSLSGSSSVGPSGHVYFAGIGYNQVVQAVPRGGGNAVSVASEPYVSDPISLAADSTNVYWLNYFYGTDHTGTVEEVPLGGGKVTTLATGQNFPISLAVDSAHVYWVTWEHSGTVNEVPIGGGPVTTLASGQSEPVSLAVEGTHVYWVNHGDGTVNEVPVGGGSVTTLATGQPGAVSMAVDSTHVYWGTDYGTVNDVPLGGGTVTTLATGQHFPISMAVDSTHVYWANHGGGEVNKVPLGGGNVTTLAYDQRDLDSLAVDGTHVYWVNGEGGQVNKVRLGGGRVTTIATSIWPQALAVGP